MSIWLYDQSLKADESTLGLWRRWIATPPPCPFCETELTLLGQRYGGGAFGWATTEVFVCQACGWWKLESHASDTTPIMGTNLEVSLSQTRYAHGTLRNLDVTDIGTPLSELTRYLVARRDRIGEVHSSLVEQVVGEVFRNAGFRVEITAGSGDGGVDLILLRGSDDVRIGVQVKRSKQRIEAEQIRSFLGALLLADMNRGVFVATSEFRSGAASTAERAAIKNLARIDLRNGQWLLDELRIRQRAKYHHIEEQDTPWHGLLEDITRVPLVDWAETATERNFLT